jgi:integrase
VIQLANGRVKVLSGGEVRRLAEAASPAVKTMILLVANSGLRVEGLVSLDWSDVDFRRRRVRFVSVLSMPPYAVLGSNALDLLRQERDGDDEVLFPRSKYSLGALRVGLASACQATGIGPVTFADLQSTWVYWSLRCGKDWDDVSCTLMLRERQMDQRYGQLRKDFSNERHRRFEIGELRTSPDNVVQFRRPDVTV